MYKYKIKATIETDKGEQVTEQITVWVVTRAGAQSYAKGFADGMAVAHAGGVINTVCMEDL